MDPAFQVKVLPKDKTHIHLRVVKNLQPHSLLKINLAKKAAIHMNLLIQKAQNNLHKHHHLLKIHQK